MSYSNQLEFFFDISSPWTYLAFSQIESLAERTDTEILWRPILVGGVFNAVNETVYEQRANPHPTKGRYYVKDLRDWTRFYGLEIGQPAVFPVRAVEIMRTAIVAQEEGCLPAYAWATFKAYWGALKDVSQADERARLCEQVGLDAQDVEVRIASDAVKQKLKSNTDEVIARGGFGSPTMFVNGDDMYFGNDRLALVEAALRKNIS
ncbi:2-hydroxychromene-2-carboxylate isomerase [Alphaproteobacteria bacterium]|nr:2-hydroxychromene-2-carboxylate isomerase [Alphaproteobacteria bacterium]